MSTQLYTIGHSNHGLEVFLSLLDGAGVNIVVDVRSQPVSRWVPHFNRQPLQAALADHGLGYEFLGRELGGRPKDPTLLKEGRPDYAAMARTAEFAAGLARVLELSRTANVALMCAERDPIDCHRFLLIGRELVQRGIPLAHILAQGTIEPHTDTELRARDRRSGDLFD